MKVRTVSYVRYLWPPDWDCLDWSGYISIARIANLGGIRLRIDNLLGRAR